MGFGAGHARAPLIYGTAWKKERTAEWVERVLVAGFRGIDTACQPKHYDEPEVGRGAAARARGIAREPLYLQTHGHDQRAAPGEDLAIFDFAPDDLQALLQPLEETYT